MSKTAEILCVGTEILLGNITNTNATFLSQELSLLGFNVFHHTVVGDNPERLAQAVDTALSRCDLLITTGGLGPTYDDLTKQTVARALGLEMELHEDILADLRARLLQFVSLIELELDFSEEEVQFADRQQLVELARDIETVIARLADSFSRGNAIKNGIPTIIIGETNAGKSTLLNALLREERALVSDIHGTTRDTVEDIIDLQGITYRLIDTAGIRETSDTVENMGIERTFVKLAQADIVLWLVDGTHSDAHVQDLARRIVPQCQGKQLFALINKTDLLSPAQIAAKQELLTTLHIAPERILPISAKNNRDIDTLQEALVALAAQTTSANDTIVTNVRHYEALVRALEAIRRAHQGLADNYPGDLLAQDIRETMHHLGEITGEITTDEILGNIFKNFCVGK